MPLNYDIIIPSPLGYLGINTHKEEVTGLRILTDALMPAIPRDDFSKHVVSELKKYFADPHHQFDLPLASQGSDFQKKVWKALLAIPVGESLTYGDLAKKLKTGPRAIGQACRTNPIPVIVPCHRIVASNHIGGYAGFKKGKVMDLKTWLLKHEKAL